MNILMKDVSVSAVCACPFCHLVSVLIADVFVCYCDPVSLPHYVSSQHSCSPRRERRPGKMLSCKDSLTWTTPDKHHFSSLPHFLSLSLCVVFFHLSDSTRLSASLCLCHSLSFCVSFFLLWASYCEDLNISSCGSVQDTEERISVWPWNFKAFLRWHPLEWYIFKQHCENHDDFNMFFFIWPLSFLKTFSLENLIIFKNKFKLF